MDVSDRLSSARFPRSVSLAAATSSMMASRSAASERTAPVMVASPMVRNLVTRVSTVSPSRGWTSSFTSR